MFLLQVLFSSHNYMKPSFSTMASQPQMLNRAMRYMYQHGTSGGSSVDELVPAVFREFAVREPGLGAYRCAYKGWV